MTALEIALRRKINNKTKPPGSLGVLEQIALQAGTILGSECPQLRAPHIVVFAGDHGIATTGLVNPYPQAVTAQMVHNFLNGGAAINVFCRSAGIDLLVVNAGVAAEFSGADGAVLIDIPVAAGTADYRNGAAMTREQTELAIVRGREVVRRIAAQGCNVIGFGEMGIGNTSSASLLMSAVTGTPIESCVGSGTGASGALLETKKATLKQVYDTHQLGSYSGDAVGLLAKVGGFEIAMMTGAYLEAAEARMIILVDGFIATAALLLAQELDRSVLARCIFAHASEEHAHRALLQHLGAEPVLQLGLRLGEGTGAALAFPLLKAAVAFLNEMASFDDAGVSGPAS